jgi:VanZ family protein
MQMNREQKFFSVMLAIYWAGIAAATHIPVPDWTRNMSMSDKTMHVAAYMLLGFLLWFAVGFGEKANWRKTKPWLVLAALLVYGIADEISQQFVRGRSADAIDFVYDMVGIAAAMLTVSLMPSRLTIIVPAIVCPFLIPGLVRSGLIAQGTFLESAIYFACFATVSLIIGLTLKNKFIGLIITAADLLFLKMYAVLTDKVLGQAEMLISIAAIVIMFVVLFYLGRVKRVAN